MSAWCCAPAVMAPHAPVSFFAMPMARSAPTRAFRNSTSRAAKACVRGRTRVRWRANLNQTPSPASPRRSRTERRRLSHLRLAVITSEPPARPHGSDIEAAQPPTKQSGKWIWGAAVAGIVLGAAATAWFLPRSAGPAAPAESPIDMTVTDRNSQLVIDWDHAAARMAAVRGGQLVITDGDATARFALDADDARTGSFTWARRSGDIRIALHLDTGAKPLSAFARYIGGPPAPAVSATPGKQKAVRVGNDPANVQLRKENAALRESLAQADARATQAENLMRILRNRLDAAEARAK